VAPITVEKWVDDHQAQERCIFLCADAVAGSGLSAEALKKVLQRLIHRGRVLKAMRAMTGIAAYK
jgi:hypothetical protein